MRENASDRYTAIIMMCWFVAIGWFLACGISLIFAFWKFFYIGSFLLVNGIATVVLPCLLGAQKEEVGFIKKQINNFSFSTKNS
jgi:hypothetical protein